LCAFHEAGPVQEKSAAPGQYRWVQAVSAESGKTQGNIEPLKMQRRSQSGKGALAKSFGLL